MTIWGNSSCTGAVKVLATRMLESCQDEAREANYVTALHVIWKSKFRSNVCSYIESADCTRFQPQTSPPQQQHGLLYFNIFLNNTYRWHSYARFQICNSITYYRYVIYSRCFSAILVRAFRGMMIVSLHLPVFLSLHFLSLVFSMPRKNDPFLAFCIRSNFHSMHLQCIRTKNKKRKKK